MHQDWASFDKEKGNTCYELLCTLDEFDDLIADDDQPDKYELWCHNLVINEILKDYKLHDNEGVVIYKDGDIDSSNDKGDN